MLAIKLKTVLAGLLVVLGFGTAALPPAALAQEKHAQAQKNDKVVTPEQVIKEKPKETVQVEFRVADVGRILAQVKKGEEIEPPLQLFAEDNEMALRKVDDSFSVVVLGKAVRHLKRVGIEDPTEHFRGKVVRLTGTVRVMPRTKGTGYELWVERLDQIEAVKKQ
jgi:hypothetical protein